MNRVKVQTARTLLKRHEVVHSLWPFSGSSRVRGWRNVPKSRRQHHDRPVEWTSQNAEQLPDLVAEFVEIIDRCRQIELWIPAL